MGGEISTYLVQKNHLRSLKKQDYYLLRLLTRFAKNLYNHTLYTIRQHFFEQAEHLRYEQAYHVVKTDEPYRRMPSQVAQQTMKMVDRGMRSFFALLNKKQNGRYQKPVRIPRYLPKTGHSVCIFPKDSFKVMKGQIRLSLGKTFTKMGTPYLYFRLPPHIRDQTIKEVRIIPRYQGRYFEIVYVYQVEPEAVELDSSKCLAVDLGLDNFATCVSTDGTAFIMEGKGVKSYNRWWNKTKAEVQSIYDRQGIKFGAKLAKLLHRRQTVLNNFLAQTVNYIVQACLRHKIGTIVIGELKGIKQHQNHGRKTNQSFQSIPFHRFKQKLRAKCEVYGIVYQEVAEAYTSQTCSACGIVQKSNRKHRGLYVCQSCGIVRNADVNGAMNILKKVAPESLSEIGSSGRVSRPRRIRLPTVFENPASQEDPAL